MQCRKDPALNFDAMAQYLPLYEDAAWLTLSIGWIGIAGSVIIGSLWP